MDELNADERRERDAFTAAYWNGRVRVIVHAAPSPRVADVLDLIEQPGGTDWWRANGRSYWGTFDLRERSRSMRVLQGYTDDKGITI